MSLWSTHVLPRLVEKACRSHTIKEERARWVPRAHGRTLEIGVGSGLNLAFYDPARVEKVTGIDPSEPLLARARERARGGPVPVELVLGCAEALPFPDASFDSALVTYSLCSVEDPGRALAEIRRVLRDDGELLFVEHGLAPDPGPRRWQQLLTPLWRRVSGNCHLDRDVFAALREGGFRVEDARAEYGEGARWLSFTYEGAARRA
jgi:ubiquinone/menaquinone biosynthesis C-methylase UbiE